ncbi:hypothetical protein CLAIMM_13331 [Cladophialophora immunda]|nr:hypothetical protein CLAIMM_13331 [Cladophialophora immunda]
MRDERTKAQRNQPNIDLHGPPYWMDGTETKRHTGFLAGAAISTRYYCSYSISGVGMDSYKVQACTINTYIHR